MENKLLLILIIGIICLGVYLPNDTYINSQWAIKNTGSNIPGGVTGVVDCDMDLDSAWEITLGSDKVIVGIIDSGVDTNHLDLVDNIVSGYNFRDNNTNVFDDFAHGTATAGVIGAIGNNNRGITGVAPNCKIMPIKFFNYADVGNNYQNVTSQMKANSINYSWKYNRCDVVNLSFGVWQYESEVDYAIDSGVAYGRSGKGVVFVSGTGNNGADSILYPARHQDVIAVGGIDACNKRKMFNSTCSGSNWSSNYSRHIHVVAPSVKIYTTDITGSGGWNSSGDYEDGYTGTSAATPNVAGVCALMLSLDSTLTWDTVRAVLCRTAEKVGDYDYDQSGPLGIGGWNEEMGYGLVNANNALLEVEKKQRDVNFDGEVDATDFLLVYNCYLVYCNNADYDVNRDWSVDMTDVLLIYNYTP